MQQVQGIAARRGWLRRPAQAGRIGVVALLLFGALGAWLVPPGWRAARVLVHADDPAVVADRMLDRRFDAAAAAQGIDAALADRDADLAQSFVALADARHVAVDADRRRQVAAAVAEAASFAHTARSFATGFVSGEPRDASSFAGTAFGDLFVFGDIRDAVREGGRLAMGEKADELVLGLACVGLAITAGTYATLGAALPLRAGLTTLKVARKVGGLGADLATAIGRMLRRAIDWRALKGTGTAIAEPAVAARAARGAVRLERSGRLLDLVRDVGTIEAKAGTSAALDSLRVAGSPRQMSRLARLAEREGGRTRAILKVGGRSAIVLGAAAFDLAGWVFGAALSVLGLVVSLKRGTERLTESWLRRRKARRRRMASPRFAGCDPQPA